MSDSYRILGVARDASRGEIIRSYLKGVRQIEAACPGNKPVPDERYQQISSALFEIIRGTSAPPVNPRAEIADNRPHPAPALASAPAPRNKAGTSGNRTSVDRPTIAVRGRDIETRLRISFIDAAKGTTKKIGTPRGNGIHLQIPAGSGDGQKLRLPGWGFPGANGGQAGDMLVLVSVTPHRFLRREGNNIVMERLVTLDEAVLGAVISVPTILGSIAVIVPPGSDTGTRLWIRGRGINGADQCVVLKVVLGPAPDPALIEFLKSHRRDRAFDRRQPPEWLQRR